MSLSCSCDDFELSGDSWLYYQPSDFDVLNTRKRKRCCSCGDLIGIGHDCVEFPRVRGTRGEYEERRFGDCGEIELASWWMREDCGGLYFSLTELGYCITLGDDMRSLVAEYAAVKWIERHVARFNQVAALVSDQMPDSAHYKHTMYEVHKAVAELARALEPPVSVTVDQICRQLLISTNRTSSCVYCQRFIHHGTRIVATGGSLFHADCLALSGYLNG